MKTKLILDTDLIAIESEDKVTLMVDLTAPVGEIQASRPARGVQICLDISGSMEGAPLASAKESILKLIDRLDKKDTFGMVIFDDTAKVAVPTKPLIDHDIAQLKKAIRKIQTGGSTDISAGFTLAMREASRTKARRWNIPSCNQRWPCKCGGARSTILRRRCRKICN
jgi:Ca-activated chloride channel homolog